MDDIYEEIVNLKKNGEEGVLVTVVSKEGHTPADVQKKMLVFPGGKKAGTVGGGSLEHLAVETAEEVLRAKKGFLKEYSLSSENEVITGEETGMICGGSAVLFFEYIGSGEQIFIFGAGHVGRALMYHLKHLDYYLTIIDNRDDALKGIEDAQKVLHADYSEGLSGVRINGGSYVVIATHSHDIDFQILKEIFQSGVRPKYIGLIGSRNKVALTVKRLRDETGSGIELDSLYSPIGLDTGGKSPHDIAISIVSEIQALRHGIKGNKHLSRKG